MNKEMKEDDFSDIQKKLNIDVLNAIRKNIIGREGRDLYDLIFSLIQYLLIHFINDMYGKNDIKFKLKEFDMLMKLTRKVLIQFDSLYKLASIEF
jgi:hypothetical protein